MKITDSIFLMKRNYLTFLFIIVAAICTAQEKPNVTLTLHVSPYINEVEQMVYAWHYEEDDCFIDDSVKIVTGKDTYVLHCCVPYKEGVFKLNFSKRGPFEMSVLAHPGEELEMEINEADDQLATRWKKLLKGSAQNDSLVSYHEVSDGYTRKIRQLEDAMSVYGTPHERIDELADSINYYKQQKTRLWLHVARTSPFPYIATQQAYIFLWNNISAGEYKSLGKSLYMRFPDYPPMERMYLNKKVKPATRESNARKQFLKKMVFSRIAIKQEQLKADTLKLGETVTFALVDSMGQRIPISNYKGKYVLVEMWASWCVPCIKAMPNIQKAQQMFHDNFVCCAITIDKSATPWKQSIKNYHLQDLHHYKATDENGNLREDMKPLAAAGNIPRNYLLDREGRIIAIDIYGEELIKKLEELTKE